jgi:hypothetical protein
MSSGGLRKRNVQLPEEQDDESATSKLVSTLKSLDVYPKIEEEHSIKTNTGGTITLVTLIIISILFFSELYNYFSISTNHSISVDTRTQQKIFIEFNVTFPRLPCNQAGIDVMDASGDEQQEATKNFFKQRLNPSGGRLGDKFQDSHDSHDFNKALHDDEHNDRGAERKNQPTRVEQIVTPAGIVDVTPRTIQAHEGCELSGELVVKKVAGNLHIALGTSHVGNRHVHQFMLNDMMNYDSSHTINSLAFGPDYPGLINPLDNTKQSIYDHRGARTAHFQYFVKIVPVVYTDLHNKTTQSSQYSVTTQTQFITAMDAMQGNARRIPGLFIIYDLSPFCLTISEKSMRFTEFLVSLCAILGGVLTIAGIVDSLMHHSVMALSPRHR